MTLNAVVLPAPLGPIRPGDVPFLDVERDAVERDDSAEAQGDVPYLEEGHPQETLNGPTRAVATKALLDAHGWAAARSRSDQSCTTDPAGTRIVTESTPRAFVERVPPSQLQPLARRIRRRYCCGPAPRPNLAPEPDAAAAPRRAHEREAERVVRGLLHAVGGREPALPAVVGLVVANEEEDQHVDEAGAVSTRRAALATCAACFVGETPRKRSGGFVW